MTTELLTVSEWTARDGRSRSTAYRLIARGELVATKVNRRWLITVAVPAPAPEPKPTVLAGRSLWSYSRTALHGF